MAMMRGCAKPRKQETRLKPKLVSHTIMRKIVTRDMLSTVGRSFLRSETLDKDKDVCLARLPRLLNSTNGR
jgi:hypothetical protein